MAKVLTPWTDGALHLWAQSESNAAGIQLLKSVLTALDFGQDAPQALLEAGRAAQESIKSIQNSIAISNVFNREQARRSLFALNPEVFVELYFPLENKRYVERMTYTICQNKMVEWSKNSVSICWWPVNFKTHDEAKAFAVQYLDAVLKSLDKKKVAL